METVAIVSIVSVLIWFIMGFRNSVNLDDNTEDELKEEK